MATIVATDETSSLAPAQHMIQLSSGYLLARALYVTAELGIADLLGAGRCASADLAAAVGVHEQSLYRVLRTLASVGVFVEEEGQTFRLTPLGETLRSNVPGSVRNWVLINGTIAWRAFSEMPYSVRTGNPGFDRAYGMPIFEYLAQHPDEAAMFSQTMIDYHGPEAAAVAEAYDLSDAQSVMDLGGGIGNLLEALLNANSQLMGTLFDLPHVADAAAQRLRAAGLDHRCDVVAGDFFDHVPPGHDVYVLSHVIHDWDEAHCLTLLGNCHRAMPPRGRLLIVEMVLPGPNQPSPAKLTDLMMLVGQRGQERTADEYAALLAKADFRLGSVVTTASAVSVIEAIPAASA